MANGHPAKPFCFLFSLNGGLVLFVICTPILFANNAKGTATGLLLLIFLFFFPGYALLSLMGASDGGLRMLLSPVFGIAIVVTLYDCSVRFSAGTYFPYFAAAVSCMGVLLFLRNLNKLAVPGLLRREDLRAGVAGACVVLAVAPLYWRSGRFSHGEFVFYGPAGQDPLFHVTLLQRLMAHVPPDNFMMAGLRAPVYHYFGDLTLAFTLQAQRVLHCGLTDVFDLYYRCYPTLLYFLLGALAYRVGWRLTGKTAGGMFGVVILLGSGSLGWLLGAATTLAHAANLASLRTRLFTEWTTWNGVDGILPLVHRPANYHGLMISLAAIALLIEAQNRRVWIAAGLLVGVMAGFNFTLAATFGGSAVFAAILFWVRSRRDRASELAWFATFILIGSLPVLMAVLFSGFHNAAPGFPFRGPSLEFTNGLWGGGLPRVLPSPVVPLLALVAFVIAAYGIRLAGLRSLLRADVALSRSLALVLAIAFAISFVLGTFFPYKALDGIAIVFLQPSLWILGLFSIVPLAAWLERNSKAWHALALWAVLIIPWIQALAAFNLGRKADFSAETIDAMKWIRTAAPREQVIAFVPSDLEQKPLLGIAGRPTDFAITALTGLDGYFSTETYSISYAVPSLQGKDDASVLEQARQIYLQRRADVASFLQGNMNAEGRSRLAKDNVCWVIAFEHTVPKVDSGLKPWRSTSDMDIFNLCR